MKEATEGGYTNLIRKSIQNSESIKSKFMTKLFDRTMSRIELWNNKVISTTLTVPGTVSTTATRKIWSKILRKTSVKKLKNKCGCQLLGLGVCLHF